MEKNMKKNVCVCVCACVCVQVCVQLNDFSVHLKLIQYCKSTILIIKKNYPKGKDHCIV